MMTGIDEKRDLEDGEIMKGGRDHNNTSSATNGHNLSSPSRIREYGDSGSVGGRDSALSNRQSEPPMHTSKRRKKQRKSKFDDELALSSAEENLNYSRRMERQVITRDDSPNEADEFDRRMGSHSPNIHSFGRKDAGKRTDLPRYDVRNVIERKKKDKGNKEKRDRFNSRSPRSKSPNNPLSPRSRSRSLSPRGRRINNSKTKRKKNNKTKSNLRLRSRSRSRSLSPRRSGSYSRSRSRSRSPMSHKRKKSKKSGKKYAPRTPSPRGRRIGSPIKKRGRQSLSRSPSFERPSRGFTGSGIRRRVSRSPIRGAVDISPPPTKGRKGRNLSSPTKGKRKSDNTSFGSTKKSTKPSRKKRRDIDEDLMPISPVDVPSSNKKFKTGKKNSKIESKGKNKGEQMTGSKQPKKKRHDTSHFNDLSMLNTHSSSVVEKEVYAAGDKIMVSVNFKSKPKKHNTTTTTSETFGKDQSASNSANNKPMVVIDCLSSPYQVIEPSPSEVIDIYSEEDDIITGESSAQVLDPNKQTPSKKAKKQKQQKLQVLKFLLFNFSLRQGSY